MTRYVSENEWYGMRRDKAEGKSIRKIAAKYRYNRRIVRRETADIKPGVQCTEDELRGLVTVSEPTEKKDLEKTDKPPDHSPTRHRQPPKTTTKKSRLP